MECFLVKDDNNDKDYKDNKNNDKEKVKEIEENKDGKKKRNEELIAKYLTGPRDELLKSKLPNLETIAKKNKSKKEDYIKAFKPFIEDAEKLVIWDKKRRGLISPPQKGGGKSATDIKKATFDELRNINLNELIKYFNKKKVTSKDLFKGEVDLIPFDEKKGKKVIPLHITVKLNLYKRLIYNIHSFVIIDHLQMLYT